MRCLRSIVIIIFVIICMAMSFAQQSNNHGLPSVPAPAKMVIDGKLDEWDLSGTMEVFANYRMRNAFSAKVSSMYDKDNFYLAVQWRDATPLYNMVNANFDIGSGWRSDCVQLRLRSDISMHIDCWYSTEAKRPVVKIDYGSYKDGAKNPQHVSHFKGIQDGVAIGAREAFTICEDGQSYIQEIALPWKMITGAGAIDNVTGLPFAAVKEYKAGDKFDMGMEFLWGGMDGKTWPIHRYADFLKEGKSSREFFWVADNEWGTVTLEPKGNLKLTPPDYSDQIGAYLQKTSGPMAIKYKMPADGFVTLVIEDEQGCRVKNIIGMATRAKGDHVDYWDGTDEKGKLVAPGTYRWRGLMHQGIQPVYDATYGNPGTPPWDTADGTGAWLSDHKPPCAIAAGKEMIVAAADEAESGWAIMGIDMNGRKKWGDRKFHGIKALAADDNYVYAYMAPWGNPVPTPTIGRLDIKTGKFAPFATTPEPKLEIPAQKKDEKIWVPGFAVGTDRMAISLPGPDIIRFFNKTTADIVEELPVPKPGCLTYDAAGILYVMSEGKVIKVIDGKLTPVVTDKLGWIADMAVDKDGNIFLAEQESNTVKVFDKTGKFLRNIGIEGGRPARGKWQPNGMRNPTGIDIDSQGRLWVAENDATPKRISVWNINGQLIKDYIGPTGYGGTGASADPDDKTRVFGSGCEFKMDYENNKATVVTVLGQDNGMWMKANGREYYMTLGGRLYLRDGDKLRKVGAIGRSYVKDMADEKKEFMIPDPPAGTHGYATFSYVWTDANDDGAVQAEEVNIGSGWTGWKVLKYPVSTSGYFGSCWLDDNFNVYGYAYDSYGAWGGRGPFVTKIPLKGWTPGGAPIWDVPEQKLLYTGGLSGGTCLYLPTKGKAIFGEPLTCVDDNGKILWSYSRDMFAGVHASHDAFIPERDDIMIGSLGFIGKAETKLGTVFAAHSNMGRMYLLTEDGLFVASVFQDTRLGSDGFPDTPRKGAPLGGITMGGEWFGGSFFKSVKTNEYYLIAGFTSYNLIKLNGFDTLRAIPGGELKVTAEDIKAAQEMLSQQAVKDAAKNTLVIDKAATPPVIDGKLNEYAKEKFVEWSSGPYKIKAAISVDAVNMYLAYDVNGDNNPMVNGGKDVNQLFSTGDSVDLQLATDLNANAKRTDAAKGDLRLLISVIDNKPVAVLYKWKVDGEKTPVTFTCPWRSHTVDSVSVVKDAQINIAKRNNGYIVEAAIPLTALGFIPVADKTYKLDMGVIFSDATGTNRAARVYWANKATGLVSDVPGEIMANPNLWGKGTVAP